MLTIWLRQATSPVNCQLNLCRARWFLRVTPE